MFSQNESKMSDFSWKDLSKTFRKRYIFTTDKVIFQNKHYVSNNEPDNLREPLLFGWVHTNKACNYEKYIPTGRVNKVTTTALEANTKFVIDKFVGEDN